MSTKQHDFTRGNPLRQLVAFSGPMMLANLLQLSFQLVDSLWVGNLLGAQALGAVAISSVIMFTVLSFVIGMNNAALVILSQLKGRQDAAGLERYLNAFVVLLFLMSLALGITGYFSADALLHLLGTPEEIFAGASEYLRITFLGMLFLFGYNFISTVLRALGDSKTPMRFVLVAVILNAIINPVLIHTLDLGIRGAAFATVISQGVAFLYGLITVAVKRLAPLTVPTMPSVTETRTILKLGIPSGLQMAVISGGSAAIMSVVTSFGADVVGGFSAAQRLDALIMLPAQALGIAVSSMAGQNIGIAQWGRVSRITRVGLGFNLAVMVTIALVLIVLADYAVGLFIDDADAKAFATTYLRIIALCYPFLGINFILNGVVRAAGAMYQVLVLNIISFWVLRYPLVWLMSEWLGSTGIAVGMGLSFIVSSGAAFVYFRFGKWREREIFSESVRP